MEIIAEAHKASAFKDSQSQITNTWENERFRIASCSMQGHRNDMEDAHCIQLVMPNHPDCSFFGVFDGHGGRQASKWTARNLPVYLDSLKDFSDEALVDACLRVDEDLDSAAKSVGTAAVFAIVQSRPSKGIYRVTIGNVGDSRACLIREGKWVESLTQDHKPTAPAEHQRILNAGGQLRGERVGSLNLSRTFGDSQYKHQEELPRDEQLVVAVPDVVHTEATSKDYLLLFCDGIVERDAFTNRDAVAFIMTQLKANNNDMTAALRALTLEAQRRGSHDNMTALLIDFKSFDTLKLSEEGAQALSRREAPTGEVEPHAKAQRASLPESSLQARIERDPLVPILEQAARDSAMPALQPSSLLQSGVQPWEETISEQTERPPLRRRTGGPSEDQQMASGSDEYKHSHNLRTSGAGQSSSDDMPGQPKLMDTVIASNLTQQQLENMEVERHAKYAHGTH